MILIPARLESLPIVEVYFRSPGCWMLHKKSDDSLVERQSYLALHAITMVIQGQQVIDTYDQWRLNLKAGQMAFLKKGLYTVNDLISEEGQFEAKLLFFDDIFLNAFFKEFSYKDKPIPNYTSRPFIKTETPSYLYHFWQSIQLLHTSGIGQQHDLFVLKAKEYLKILLSNVPSLIPLLSNLSNESVKNLQKFMEQHFDKSLTIDDYANLTGRSPSTFRRTFKLKFGTTPRQWVIQKRMEKAWHLLQTTNFEIAQIALEVGYENTSHFISAFKKMYGQTPGVMARLNTI